MNPARRNVPLIFVLIMLVIEAIIVCIHLAVYATLADVFGIGGPFSAAVFVFLAVTFLAASFLAHWAKGGLIDWCYHAAAYWLGLIALLFVATVIFFFTATFLYSMDIYVSPVLLAGTAFAVFFLLHLYGTWKSSRAEITSLTITLPNLPVAWRGKKVVFVSDFHLGNIWGARLARRIAKKIEALAPEAIMIGGDLYDGTACDAAKLIEPLREMKAPRGVYFITGNHEYILPDLPAALAAIRNAGIRILDNEAVDLGGLMLVGVDDATTRSNEDFKKILQGITRPAGAPAILLRHEPDHREAARDAGVSLMLSGHTHHGQMIPFNYITHLLYQGFDYGLHPLGPMQVYTSSGVGTWGPPLRLGTKSEIVAITLN